MVFRLSLMRKRDVPHTNKLKNVLLMISIASRQGAEAHFRSTRHIHTLSTAVVASTFYSRLRWCDMVGSIVRIEQNIDACIERYDTRRSTAVVYI